MRFASTTRPPAVANVASSGQCKREVSPDAPPKRFLGYLGKPMQNQGSVRPGLQNLPERLDDVWKSDLRAGVVGCEPVPVHTQVSGSVTAFDWTNETDRREACKLIKEHASYPDRGLREPVLLKNAAAHWPALQKWDLDWLARTLSRLWVWVRCAPTLRFTYVEPLLMPWYLKFRSASQAPSMLTQMPLAEFAVRSQCRNPLPPLFYTDDKEQGSDGAHTGDSGVNSHSEYYYLQSPLPKSLRQDCDLGAEPFSTVQGADQEVPNMVASQPARLWMCPRGGVSPLHYDSTTSFLTQIIGRKRLLFFRPEDLPALKPYPNWHVLRRRLRFDPAQPLDRSKFPAACALQAVEARLEPGDVLLFPPQWSHYTESLDWSLSMTWRFVHPGKRATVHRPWRSLCFRWW